MVMVTKRCPYCKKEMFFIETIWMWACLGCKEKFPEYSLHPEIVKYYGVGKE